MSKANGTDGIYSTVLKNCAPELASVIAMLFQISFDTRIVPSGWKTAIDVPKKGSKHLTLGLYQRRGVSMTHQTIDQCRCYQNMSKVMERIICDQSHVNLSKYHLICDTQYLFREKRSTVDMLSYINQWWHQDGIRQCVA